MLGQYSSRHGQQSLRGYKNKKVATLITNLHLTSEFDQPEKSTLESMITSIHFTAALIIHVAPGLKNIRHSEPFKFMFQYQI